jgi:magnesium transporter
MSDVTPQQENPQPLVDAEDASIIDGVDDIALPSPEDARVAELIASTIDLPMLAEAVQQQEAADAADTLEDLADEDAAVVLEAMDDLAAAEALAEMEEPLAIGMLEDLIAYDRTDYATILLQLMAPDDAVDLLQELDDDTRNILLSRMPPARAADLRRLALYAEDTAAGLMTTKYLALREDDTIAQATEVIRASTIPQPMHHMPVIDDTGKLTGIIGFRKLLTNPNNAVIGDLMDRSPRAVRIDLDQEEVAKEFDRYDFYMLPVVDGFDRLLGVITVDDVIDIIRVEQTEDVQKTVGAGAAEAVYSQVGEKLRGRFPWLVTSLVLTCFSAMVVIFFEDEIGERPILAVLMPVIAALVGNAGHQALAVTLRGIVLEEMRRDRVPPLIVREAMVGVLQGVLLGILITAIVTFMSMFSESATWQIGLVAGTALACSMGIGTLAGSSIPLVMQRLGRDPAQSSAIFLIMITDLVGFSTFLGLIKISTPWLGAVPG